MTIDCQYRVLVSLSLLLTSFTAVSASDIEQLNGTRLEPSAEPGLKFATAFDFKIDWLQNPTLSKRSRDDLRVSEEEIQLGLSYRRNNFLAFGEIKGIADQVVYADDRPGWSEGTLERGEMWLLFKQVLDSHSSLQIGRQNFLDPRLWWWDADLDAARFYYTRTPWHLYVGVAEDLGQVATNEDFIDPADEDVWRLLGHMGWIASERFNLQAFLLAQHDASDSPVVDGVIESLREDESDADLLWAGLRTTGLLDDSWYGRLGYRADIAVITGDEILVEFEDDKPGFSRVTGTQKRNVRGWAVDVGTTWTLPLQGDPRLKLAYAYGSGDRHPDDDTDRAFRQTGLQDKDEEFRDYGVVLRPELSNLRIATLMLGLPVSFNSRLTLGYHHFRQVDAAPFLRDTGIDREPTGKNKEIGEEISLVLQLREWEDLELDIIAGRFKAGRAYSVGAGEYANRLFFKLMYEF